MNRRNFLWTAALAPTGARVALRDAAAQAVSTNAKLPIREDHFPNRLYEFVWRNWELANTARMAEVAGTTEHQILALGAELGLPAKPQLSDDQLRRIYITVIRKNWHLLPDEQIIALLGWTPERFAFTLKEDDFLDVKLGSKPRCERLTYSKPTTAERARAANIRKTVNRYFGQNLAIPGEKPFQFVQELSSFRYPLLRDPDAKPAPEEIDLSSGWVITSNVPDLSPVVERFRTYLMRSHRCMPAPDSQVNKRFRVTIDPAIDGYTVAASAAGISVTGKDTALAARALYELRSRFEERGGPFLKGGKTQRSAQWNPRFAYSYFALYGDPLLDGEPDPFPDAYLERMAAAGLNGVWIQGVLNTLAPSAIFPEFGNRSDERLRNLQKLVARAAGFGIKIYLYMNEPRAMPASFFAKRPELKGSHLQGLYSLCTSTAVVRKWIADSLAHVFHEVPDLGGIFTITMSENHTNCFSHGGAWGDGAPVAPECPRCSKRQSWDVIAELLATFREGVRRSSAAADVIAWDWGWGAELARKTLPLLPKDVAFQSISEWDAPVHRGGVNTRVGEYSISVPGPGPRATRNWAWAREAGLKTMAKTQFNNTWEISAVPYIPVLDLILEHCDGLAKAQVQGVLASWTCGGYASPNLHAAMEYGFSSHATHEEILLSEAARRYGQAAAPGVVRVWKLFSTAFREFPYGVAVYIVPTQHGPANLLRLKPTGLPAGMILFPHDDYLHWAGKYPPAVAQAQFAKLASLWKEGLQTLETVLQGVPEHRRRNASLDVAIARTCGHHFESVANQFEFYMLRDQLSKGGDTAHIRSRMKELAEAEIELSRKQFPEAKAHSEIAYEASNHYYYTPLDLVEKVLNCEQVIAALGA